MPENPQRARLLPGLAILPIMLLPIFGVGCMNEGSLPGSSQGDAESTEIRLLVDTYLEEYLLMFPTRATGAGDHRADASLENLSAENVEAWIERNREVADTLKTFLGTPVDDLDLYLDAQAVHGQAASTLFQWQKLDRLRQNPLFWSGILGNVAVFHLVREDRPLEERLEPLSLRVQQVPLLCDQARSWLKEADLTKMSAEKAKMAGAQLAAGAEFYRTGLIRAADSLSGDGADALRVQLQKVATAAAKAQQDLAELMEELAAEASGDPRLGELYEESFRLGTGLDEPVAQVLERAEADLAAKRRETAEFCLSIWDLISSTENTPDITTPEGERATVRQCFQRIAQDRADSMKPFVAHYQRLTLEAQKFVEENDILTPPGPLTRHVDTSPSFLAGQSVGGIYPAGPFSPDADALLFVPAIPDAAPDEMKKAFYDDFNDHFNVMITPHETIPGHYAQGKIAARGPSKIRAVFSDGVYVEGWGTFSERLMLDHGWGSPLDRVAHLKKQLENIARAIVDIRVHSQGMTQEEMLAFLRQDAIQDGQFAINMWTRAITSSPQLTTYYLGYRDIFELYEAWREKNPEAPPKAFADPMMSLGPVPVRHYREHGVHGVHGL